MKTILTLILTILTSAPAVAETVVSGGNWITRNFTSCGECQNMENLRRTFRAAHRNGSFDKKEMKKAMKAVYGHMNRLLEVAEEDQAKLRGPHYAQEIETYFYLALDAAQFDTGSEVPESVATLNRVLKNDKIFKKVMSDQEISREEDGYPCRKEVFQKRIEDQIYKYNHPECADDSSENVSNISTTPNNYVGAKPAKVTKCQEYKGSVSACEARAALKKLVK